MATEPNHTDSSERWRLVDYLAVGLSFIVIAWLLLLWLVGWTNIVSLLSKDLAASWFQAITSVIAIVAGAAAVVWQAGRQHRQQLAAERAQQVHQLRLLGGVILLCRLSLAELRENSKKGGGVSTHDLDVWTERLAAIPIFEQPDLRAAHAVTILRQEFLQCKYGLLAKEPEGIKVYGLAPAHSRRLRYIKDLGIAIDFAESLVYESLVDRGADLEQRTWRVGRKLIKPKLPSNRRR